MPSRSALGELANPARLSRPQARGAASKLRAHRDGACIGLRCRPEERAALESAASPPEPADDGAAAKTIEHIADTLAARVQKQDIDAAAVLRAVAANIQRIADGGVNAAEQATMTLDALGTKPDATAPLYDYLEHPSLYRPADSSNPVSV